MRRRPNFGAEPPPRPARTPADHATVALEIHQALVLLKGCRQAGRPRKFKRRVPPLAG